VIEAQPLSEVSRILSENRSLHELVFELMKFLEITKNYVPRELVMPIEDVLSVARTMPRRR
jgi:hypothetical protein